MSIATEPSYKFRSRSFSSWPADLNGAALAIVGTAVDDRGRASIDQLTANVKKVVSAAFNPANHDFRLDGEIAGANAIRALLRGSKRVILDATTLGLGEVLHILRYLEKAEIHEVSLLYVEPRSYQHQNIADHRLDKEFSLTSNCKFSAVQGFAHEYDPSHRSAHVFMLGFEPARLLSAIEQRAWGDGQAGRLHMIVGVPAFKPGWEINSLRSHLQVMEDQDLSEADVRYCQANSVREAYLSLWDLYRTLGDDQGCLYVSPLGTKPHALGAALFLLETKGSDIPTSLYYDHPSRVPKRSDDIGRWHVVDVTLT